MSSPSNLYAEKIFGEHPLALWALDDSLDYTSLIKESDRNLALWAEDSSDLRSGISGGTAEIVSVVDEPFPLSSTTLLTGSLTENLFGKIECISPTTIGNNGILFSNLDDELATFSISTYIYTDSEYLSKVEIGYEYYDSLSGENIQKTKAFNTSVSGKWMFFSETFDIPIGNSSLRAVLKIEYSGGSETEDNYKFFVNGLSIGQWSEEFSSTSLGVSPSTLPESIGLGITQGVEAKSYGLQDLSGYYVCKPSGALSCRNSGIPMVYGASSSTILSPNNENPSLVVPSMKMFSESGKYQNYTVEFWTRILSDSLTEKRIFGPLSSDHGIYIRGPFIILKIGNAFGSYFVGEWFRPMLINIKYSSTSANLSINGESVISLILDESDIDFEEEGWLGFYAYDEIPLVEVDCIAVYPYQSSDILSKRRWIYGQGVEFPENINQAYSGTSIFIDSPFAKYANTYSYPDIGNWDQGVLDNLVSEKGILSSPSHSTPDPVFSNKSLNSWKTDISSVQNEEDFFISLRPTASWQETDGYMLIENLGNLGKDVKGFYGVFKQKEKNSSKEILFQIEDSSNLNYLQVYVENSHLVYSFYFNGLLSQVYSTPTNYVGEQFSIGIDFKKFAEYFGGNLAKFFGRKSLLKLYVGGNRLLENTFSGNIYSVGISTERNFSKISHFFTDRGVVLDYLDLFSVDGGIPVTTFWEELYDGLLPNTTDWATRINTDDNYVAPSIVASQSLLGFVSTYTVKLFKNFNSYRIGVSTDSYWEDYLPLKYFAKYVKDANGQRRYDLDFIQFNINYPAPSKFIQSDEFSSWTYEELQEKFYSPIKRTYESLDNQLFTGYQNYEDLKNKSFKTYKYDTDGAPVKTFISFQYLASGANAPYTYFTNTISPDKNGILTPGSYIVGYDTETSNPIYDSFENTRYEVVNNMIIYPPAHVDFNELAIVTHIEMIIEDVESSPIKIKKLEFASQALNDTEPTMIGTRFGSELHPYKKSGFYLNYKGVNPYSVYRGSSPYLYMTRYSGIQLRGNYDPSVSRGIQIPINETKSPEYKVIAMQMAMRYDEDFFPYAPIQIFETESRGSLIKFYLVSVHPKGKRAKIYAVNSKTGRLENGIAFYLNGKIVKDPILTVKEWAMLGIGFSNSLNFRNYFGAIRITGPILVNTISHYKSTNLQEVQQVTNRPWFKVRSVGDIDFDWQFWDTSFIWNGVLVLSSTSYYGVSPEDIYKSYTGTNKIIVDDDRVFSLGDYEYSSLNGVVWQSQVLNAV
jgi:hypothetical protein